MKKHFYKKIATQKGVDYYISTKGEVVKNINNTAVPAREVIIAENRHIRIKGKYYMVKALVYKAVYPQYKFGTPILHKDNNKLNCNINNLISKSLHRIGKETGYRAKSRALKVKFEDGSENTYQSIKEASQDLKVAGYKISANKVKNCEIIFVNWKTA